MFLNLLLGKVATSDKIRIAHIGLGGMGNNPLGWFVGLPDDEIVALCDVDEGHLNSTMKRLEALQPGNKAKAYKDFRNIDREILKEERIQILLQGKLGYFLNANRIFEVKDEEKRT